MKKESKFISLLSDYGFKVVFADESDTTFLRRALQALIQSDTPIKKVTFLKNEFVGLTDKARGGVYDLVCEDEKERIFIVEMQLGHYKYFIQRAKFYAFQKFNTMVSKGKYLFDSLRPIYCISFLAKSVFQKSDEYYHFGRLKNQKGEEMDDQISHVIVEIAKFDKPEAAITTDLDKLIYLMKNLETIEGADQLPKFLTEDWIEQAMEKLDKSKMSIDQRADYEMMLAKNGSIIQMQKEEKARIRKEAEEDAEKKAAAKAEKKIKKAEEKAEEKAAKKIKEAEEKADKKAENKIKEAEEKADKKAENKIKEAEEKADKKAEARSIIEKKEIVINLLKLGNLSDNQISEIAQVTLEFVKSLK